jgi:putative DNA primase/helicase
MQHAQWPLEGGSDKKFLPVDPDPNELKEADNLLFDEDDPDDEPPPFDERMNGAADQEDEPPGSGPRTVNGAVLTRLSDVAPSMVRWLDRGRVPLGTVTILDGDPGVGKSSISFDYAARLTRGREMPDGKHGALYGQPSGVVILSAEDDPSYTIRPKLELMGADVDRIVLLQGIEDKRGERLPNLGDLDAIETAVGDVNAKLIIVDPFMAYLPRGKNAYRDQDMRALLTPISKLAARLDVAVLVIRHLIKGTGERVNVAALYRGGGSIGIAGAARSVLLVAGDQSRGVLVAVKGNLSQRPKGLQFRLVSKGEDGSNDEDREPPIVEWCGEVDDRADDLVRARTDDEQPLKVEEATDWLRTRLAKGPVAAKTLREEAEKDGIAWRTLERAKANMKVKAGRKGRPDWAWELPDAK